jgi:uncharacterized MnhB-related membrane protein
MIYIFALFLLTLLVITAIAIVRSEDLFVAVILTSIFSLLMAINFFILDAADVALTEAAVGAGVTTVIFLCALALTGDQEKPQKDGQNAGQKIGLVIVYWHYSLFIQPSTTRSSATQMPQFTSMLRRGILKKPLNIWISRMWSLPYLAALEDTIHWVRCL